MILLSTIYPLSFFNQTGEWGLADVLVYTVSLSVVGSPSLTGGALGVSFSGGDSNENIFVIEKNFTSPVDLSSFSYIALVMKYEGTNLQNGFNMGLFIDDGGGYKEFNYPSGDGWWLNFNNHIGHADRWYTIVFPIDAAYFGGALNKSNIVAVRIKMTDYLDSEAPSGDAYFDIMVALDDSGLKEIGFYQISYPGVVSGDVSPGGTAFPVSFNITSVYEMNLYPRPSLVRVDAVSSTDISSPEDHVDSVSLYEDDIRVYSSSYCSTTPLLYGKPFDFNGTVSYKVGYTLKDTFIPGSYVDSSANVFITLDPNTNTSGYLISFGQFKTAAVSLSVDSSQTYWGNTDGALKVDFWFPSHSGTGSFHFMLKRWAADVVDSSYSGSSNYLFLNIHVPLAPSYTFAVGPLLVEADGSIYEYDTWWDNYRVSSPGDYEWVFDLNPASWNLMGGSYDENGQLDLDQVVYAALKIDDLDQENVVVSGVLEICAFGFVKGVNPSGFFSVVQDKILVDSNVAPDRVTVTGDGKFIVYNADGYIKMKRVDGPSPYNSTEYLLSFDFDRFIHPAVSPNGSKVAVVDSSTEDDSEIYVINVAYDGSGAPYPDSLVKITDNDANEFWPSFYVASSGEEWLLFWSNRALGRADVYLQSFSSGQIIKATFQGVDQPGCFDPAISPGGRRLAYMGGLEPFWKIFVKDLDGDGDGLWDDIDLSVENGFNRSPYQISPDGDRVMWWDNRVLLVRENGSLVARDLGGAFIKEILPSSYNVQNFARIPGTNQLVAVVGDDPYHIIKFSVDIPEPGEPSGSYVSADGEPYTRLYTTEKFTIKVVSPPDERTSGSALKSVVIEPSRKISSSLLWIDVTDAVNSGELSEGQVCYLCYWDGLAWRFLSDAKVESVGSRYVVSGTIELTGLIGVLKQSSSAQKDVHEIFSPNGDGLNDFVVFTDGEKVSIYTMRGDLVLEGEVPLVFDGKSSGVPLPGGLYIYIVRDSGGRILKKGALFLLR